MKRYNSGIYIGKYFPFQNGHLKTLDSICDVCEKVYLVFFYTEGSENRLVNEFDYPLDERVQDVRRILGNRNVEVVKFCPSKDLKFPDDYLEIKSELFHSLGVDSIDVQIIGKDEENLYKDYIYADSYIVGENISIDGVNLHASLIRSDYDRYKKYLHPVVRKRLDEKLGKQKYICVTGKSGSGKSTLSRMLESELDDAVCLDIDKLAHEALKDEQVKKKVTGLVGGNILDDDGNIDRKKLGQIVFNDKELKNIVYDITWEYMDNRIRECDNNYVILDWYNIVNKRYWDIATLKVLAERDYDERKAAVIKRDNISSEYFDLREKNGVQYDDVDVDFKVDISDLKSIYGIIGFLQEGSSDVWKKNI